MHQQYSAKETKHVRNFLSLNLLQKNLLAAIVLAPALLAADC